MYMYIYIYTHENTFIEKDQRKRQRPIAAA